jgi:hypothetical protein
LLDNQSTFDLCCNRKFTSSVKTTLNALNMTSNGRNLRISEKCKLPGYKFWVWFSKKATTNIICLKNLIKIYRMTYDSEVDTTFVVHCTQFGLPDFFIEMNPCGLHVCYPKMGEFGFIQTVKDTMKLFSRRQIVDATSAKGLYEKMIFPSTADFRAIVSAGGIPGCEVTPDDVKTAIIIWGCPVLKMKESNVRRNAKRLVQSVIKVLSKLIKLQKDVELAIDIFFINKHAFFTAYSTKICFTTVTHILACQKEHLWEARHLTYKMYMLRGFRIIVLSGDQEFAALSELAGNLSSAPRLNWVAASQHCGLIE